ncbi:hypothetical protein [Streptomyces sp. SCL15-4]|uniref:hypothetical protein n=1 Tax=Streptomyces sp. SCL15-4 TaxID=2967221 RepID=UPI0029673D04|nr:hypothetical protein [Streptomyces sp. SCL15-4]
MTARDYPAERIERYVSALNDADTYAQISTPADRERFARAVMAVADAETDPVYRSGYDTGRLHAGAGSGTTAERDCLAMAVMFALQWTPNAPMGLREGIEEILATMPVPAGEGSRTSADATPGPTGRVARLLDAIRTSGGRWTTPRALRFYRDNLRELNHWPDSRLRTIARDDLRDLAAWGHLIRHEEPGRTYFVLKTRKDAR